MKSKLASPNPHFSTNSQLLAIVLYRSNSAEILIHVLKQNMLLLNFT